MYTLRSGWLERQHSEKCNVWCATNGIKLINSITPNCQAQSLPRCLPPLSSFKAVLREKYRFDKAACSRSPHPCRENTFPPGQSQVSFFLSGKITERAWTENDTICLAIPAASAGACSYTTVHRLWWQASQMAQSIMPGAATVCHLI